jgi:ankyrin repeat protein
MRKHNNRLRVFLRTGLGDKACKAAMADGNKVDCNLRDKDGYTPLIREIENGNTSAVEALLANVEVDPNLQDKYGQSPLHAAVLYSHEMFVKMLVEKSEVDPNLRDNWGRSPLWVAASSGQKTIVELLLNSDRVDLEARDESGRTPLSAATVKSFMVIRGIQSQKDVVEALLASGRVDPDAKDTQGLTPLAWIARDGWHSRNDSTKIAEILLGTGRVDPNSCDNQGVTPLMWSEACRNRSIRTLLLDTGRVHEGIKKTTGLDIDSRYIAHWITSCNAQHGGRCKPTRPQHRLPHQKPGWVIDIKQGCLVPGNTVPRYIALSYVWSNDDDDPSQPLIRQRPIQASQVSQADLIVSQSDVRSSERILLKKSNLLDFQEPDYLQEHVTMQLPAAVRDAMVLVQKIGERYLWVDCLCIVQDDEKTREQVDRMGDIYSGAYFTIIAATSSGKLSYHSPHVKTDPPQAEDLYADLYDSKWATRGWTFQEQMLSKRSVIFTERHIFWECQQCVWDMDGAKPEITANTSFARPHYERAHRISVADVPFSMYIEMISLYNSRDLTYPQDILAAFSGVLNSLTCRFPSGFVCGLPQMYLDVALLWQPFRKAQRRVTKDGGSTAASKNLPSWSWCGWKCPVDPFHLRTRSTHLNINEDYQNSQAPMWKTHKLVEWYSLSEDMQCQSRIDGLSTSKEGVPMKRQNGILRNIKRKGFCISQDLENGHSAHAYKAPLQACSPMPLEAGPQYGSLPQNIWPFLSCETTRAFLRTEVVLPAMPEPPPPLLRISGIVFKIPQFANAPDARSACDLICLEDKRGHTAGVLRRMDDTAISAGDLVELIAISTGVVNMSDIEGHKAENDVYETRVYCDPDSSGE